MNFDKLKVEKVSVSNLEGAIRGMRNPLDSHHLSDSCFLYDGFVIGEKDMKLARQLTSAGSDHRKFLRQIFVCFDATMPEYWWKQYHTYKVSTTENSSSQMHTLGKRILTHDDFLLDEADDLDLSYLNNLIEGWQRTKDKNIWRRIVQLMPQSYLYKKTCTMTYETLLNMYNARKNHKLDEWKWFLKVLVPQCTYFTEITKGD